MRDYRPYYHFTPPQNWMNDPNGLVYHDGEYHLFYQHNPYGTGWGHMSWGHAVSKDLLSWTHLPIAILEEPDVGFTIFSGSAISHNDEMVAVYTADYRKGTVGQLETIHCAISKDKGRTFVQSSLNPLLNVDDPKFGDPKVFWDTERGRWVMVNIRSEAQGYVMLYCSEDLETWILLSEFHGDKTTPGMWECPDLFQMAVNDDQDNVKWVMKVNYLPTGAKLYATRYFIGDFDGTEFTCDGIVGQGLTSDDGTIYAEVTYNATPDGRRILMGWLREEPFEDRPWTGAQAIPRELSLRSAAGGVVLCQRPLCELDAWRSEITVDACDLRAFGSRVFEIELLCMTGKDCNVTLRTNNGDVHIGLDTANAELYCDHTFRGHISSVFSLKAQGSTLRIFVDEAIIEVFADDQAALTTYVPFGTDYEALDIGEASQVRVWSLNNPG